MILDLRGTVFLHHSIRTFPYPNLRPSRSCYSLWFRLYEKPAEFRTDTDKEGV